MDMANHRFPGKLGIQQRVLPTYRAAFFNALAEACEGGLGLFSGEVHREESIPTTQHLQTAKVVNARNIHLTKVHSPLYALWQRGLLSWLEDWNPDILIVEANPRYLSTRRAVRWMHERERAVVGWGLGAPPIKESSSILWKLFARWQQSSRNKFLHQLDAIIAYSERGADEYRREKVPPEKIFVAPNAVAGKPQGTAPIRPEHFDQSPKLLFVGRLQTRKRIDNLLFACSHIGELIEPSLWIVGDGPAREALQELAANIYPKAEFFGQLQGPELENRFSKADLFVLPGTGGLAVQEAMTYGLPVVVAEGDGTQEDLVKAGNGWLIPANDQDSLVNVLVEALSDPIRLRRMGEESFRVAQQEINVEYMVEVFVRVLNKVNYSVDNPE
jgi:glycosyltransferase involved in cell wall biosynthesis